MNERIEKLAELCGFRPSPSIYDRNQSFDIEKFAELIVRECIGIAYEYDEPKLSGPGMIIGNRIEEHFGVEE